MEESFQMKYLKLLTDMIALSHPMNNFECHLQIHGKLRTEKNQKILLQKTMKYLLKQKYVFNEIDKLFIEKYKDYYLEN